MNKKEVELLRTSLTKFGIIKVLLVRSLPDGKYELIDGENRIGSD